MRTNNKGVYIKVLKNNNRLLSGYYSFHIVSFQKATRNSRRFFYAKREGFVQSVAVWQSGLRSVSYCCVRQSLRDVDIIVKS